jgi:hypothetical protein
MKAKNIFGKVKFKWLLAFVVISACVERIDFDVPPAQSQMVVEGSITDEPGPYTVTLSKALNLNSDSVFRDPITDANIKLYDDEGNVENFTEGSPGVYSTFGNIQGQVGHSYYIRIQTANGNVFESEPDQINPVGTVEEIRYQFEARTIKKETGDEKADVFKIYVDAKGASETATFTRWRFKGTYKVLTNPELRRVKIQEFTIMQPLPCSGYIVAPAPNGGRLEQIAECTCCTCWVNQFENTPQLSDEQLINGNQFSNILVGEVPINSSTFYEKYLVEVEQLSLSRKAFDFFKLIRAQKEGTSSLFQPPSGEIRGNIKAVNSNEPVVGIFWAAAKEYKSKYIYRNEVPYTLPPIVFVTEKCTDYYPNSTTTKPEIWNE